MPDPTTKDEGTGFAAVILAAGASSRMGAVKQLLPLEGVPLLARVVDEVLLSGASPVVVVLGANEKQIMPSIAGRPVIVVSNPQWAKGLSSSIRVGMTALLHASPETQVALLTPCDQPALSVEIISDLISTHRKSGLIACARFQGRNASPAVFGRRHFDELGDLCGDHGARELLNGDPRIVAAIEMPSLGVDLDTMSDYENWKK